jgi:hypothetical protein
MRPIDSKMIKKRTITKDYNLYRQAMLVVTEIFYPSNAALFRLVHLLIQLFIEVIEGDDDVFWGIKRHIVAMQVELLFI